MKTAGDARILIRAANWVGDAIMTTPVVRALRKNYPNAHITVLAKPWVVPVYAHNPHVDEVMVYENNGRHRMGLGTLRLARDMRARSFDLAILMQNAFEAALLAFLAGIPERVGYNTDGRTPLLKPAIPMDKALKREHLIEYYKGILHGAGLESDGSAMDLYMSQGDKDFAKSYLEERGLIEAGKPVLGINPGATGGTAKRWFPQRYAELAGKLARKYKTRVLIFGGPADRELGEEIVAMAPDCCINAAGATSLGQAFALIGQCNLFVTNDSGLMHAAAAQDVPQVAVMGSTDYIATAPFSKAAVMVREPVHCSPCMKADCPTDHACMAGITADRVFGTGVEILNKTFGS
ncbi:MAG: lipopolysaccharide heptosyltransferase II [Desulfobacterales bacterium]|nr:lipopolysaccharide heptosyltransferase II [Desulfobacterales bacterium]